jgi:hypothetical protein
MAAPKSSRKTCCFLITIFSYRMQPLGCSSARRADTLRKWVVIPTGMSSPLSDSEPLLWRFPILLRA